MIVIKMRIVSGVSLPETSNTLVSVASGRNVGPN